MSSSTASNFSNSTNLPDLHDYVKIGNILDSEVVEIEGNIYKLFNGNSLMYVNGKWKLLIDIEPENIKFYKKDFGVLNPYLMVQILINVPDVEFKHLCVTNSEISNICSGKMTDEMKQKHGDLTKDVYEGRSKKWISPDIIEFGKRNLSWRDFYNKYMQSKAFVDGIVEGNTVLEVVEELVDNDDLIGFIYFTEDTDNYFTGSELDKIIIYNRMDMLKYVLGRQPDALTQYHADTATYTYQPEMIQFLAEMGLLPNQDAVDHLGEILATDHYLSDDKRAQIQESLNFLASLTPPLLPQN